MKRWISLVLLVCLSTPAWADKIKYKKTQELNFDGANVDGEARTPTGAYLVQKRGIKFMPLYKVNENFDSAILESVEYLR